MHFRFVAAAVLSATLISAQGRGPTSGGTTGGGTTTTPPSTGIPGRTTGTSNNNSPLSTNPFPGDTPRPILITGKIMLDDGTPPPAGILIERICAGGRPHPEAYTDSKGHFSVTLGQEIG